jgi:hypothetical protein
LQKHGLESMFKPGIYNQQRKLVSSGKTHAMPSHCSSVTRNQMTKLLAILFLGLASCQQLEKTDESAPSKDRVVDSINSPMSTAVAEKNYSLDEIYQKYISVELLSYLEAKYPTWSVPNENMWYPQLFHKYKTDSSLVNYISGDFDCNGQNDQVLIVDKGKNMLSVVAFLRVGDSFKTVELTEIGPAGEKIEFVLTLYKPGRYQIADPDLGPSDSKIANFKCNGVGIGKFKELYEGGNDVFYWDHNELRSCVIEK